MAAEQVHTSSDASGFPIKHLRPLQVDPVINTHVQGVIRRGRPVRIRQIEIVFLKSYHTTVTLHYSHLPCQNAIVPSPSVTPDSVVRLGLREHLMIKSDGERLELLTGLARGLRHIHDLDIIHSYLEDLWKQTGTRGAVRISDSWKSSIFPSKVTGSTTDTQLQPSFIRGASEVGFSRASSMEIHKADDMYVFGLLAWELFAGKPLSRPADEMIITADSASARLRQPNHPELSDQVWDMIEKCLETEPPRRLTVAEVDAILEAEPVYLYSEDQAVALLTKTFCAFVTVVPIMGAHPKIRERGARTDVISKVGTNLPRAALTTPAIIEVLNVPTLALPPPVTQKAQTLLARETYRLPRCKSPGRSVATIIIPTTVRWKAAIAANTQRNSNGDRKDK